MFPSFDNLAQRELKRLELLQKSQLRVKQANLKRVMFAETNWASDLDNTITTLKQKQDISTQTEYDASAKVSDGLFKKNDIPVTSQDEIPVTSPDEVKPNTETDTFSDKIPDVSTMDDDEDTSTMDEENEEINQQREAKEAVIKIFEVYPVLDKLNLHPLSSNERQLNKYYLRKNAKVETLKGRHVIVPSIDWDKTYDSIHKVILSDPRFLTYIKNRLKQRSTIFPEYNDDPVEVWKLIGGKRKRTNTSEGDDSNRSKQRLDDSFVIDNSTSTELDEEESKLKLFWMIYNNIKLIETNDLKKSIVPILKGGLKNTTLRDNDSYIWIKDNNLVAFGKDSDVFRPAVTQKVDWFFTLKEFIEKVKDQGHPIRELRSIDNKDKTLNAKAYKQAIEGEPRHGTMSGIDEDMDRRLSNSDNDAKTILTEYYKLLHAKRVKIAFRLVPIVNSKKGVKNHSSYYFGEPRLKRPLNLINTPQNPNDKHNPISGTALSDLMKNIRWKDTLISLDNGFDEFDRYLQSIDDKDLKKELFENLTNNRKILNEAVLANSQGIQKQIGEEYDESEAAFNDYQKAQQRYDELKKLVKSSNSTAMRSALKAAASALKATEAVYHLKAKKDDVETFSELQDDRAVKGVMKNMLKKVSTGTGLKGRGLRGAGVKPLEGVVRRGRTYNLNEIQGLATPSAYIYRQLGSKYIRLPDLDAKTLIIVQPNRRKCGPKRQISSDLQSMLKDLVYNQNISQDGYDRLSVDDQHLFKEILNITHLQHSFHDKLPDPLTNLKMEYEKLKGELMLGNDNPSIIKQLKSLSVDMYSNKLIGDKEFKDIISRLI